MKKIITIFLLLIFCCPSYAQLYNIQQQISELEKTIKQSPKDPMNYLSLGSIYLEQEDYDKALEYHLKALRYNPPNKASVLLNTGIIYLTKKKEPSIALPYFRQAQKLDPLMFKAYYQAGRAYYYQQKYKEALREFKKAYKLYPKGAAICFYYADTLFDLGHFDKAEKFYNKSIQYGMEEKDLIYYNLALIYEIREDIFTAKEYYKKSIEANQSNPFPPAYNNLGHFYYTQRKYIDAIQCFSKAIRFAPEFANPHYGLGLVYKEMGEKDEALKYLEQAKDLYDPSWPDDRIARNEVIQLINELKGVKPPSGSYLDYKGFHLGTKYKIPEERIEQKTKKESPSVK